MVYDEPRFELTIWLDRTAELTDLLNESWQKLETEKGQELSSAALDFKQSAFKLKAAINNYAAEPFVPHQPTVEQLKAWAKKYDQSST